MNTYMTRKWLASALAFGAIAVPAFGSPYYDYENHPMPIPTTTTSTITADHPGPSTFLGGGGRTTRVSAGVPLGDDHARTDSATTAPSVPVTPPQTVATASSGFDWEDAGLGFGTAAGIALLTAGAVMSTRKLREPRNTSFV